ncbi:hypothetical protein GGH12_002051 [Coemansia sp. RSA 1822]|nr:hypothetical protein LPJ76_000939 [Coemansia sp. RSA 638]KAJ2123288.1 hypothetical protein IW147_002658 [Coemansia sp. RSA 720]KAJ2478960.1 hypothetical protein IWW56_003393 [Coemansia sp. RSA 2131]KAJ2544639.1 hypothetical protein GGF49_001125 [Coemansia sp. RSA 1853]KAJ2564294.1 hypothetical protein GGH12_002051 [Coemansia sp. RSA 1822]KAJ2663206.1 hypothetical protein IW148_002539 [Coemansia sp. RSA 1199]
MFGGILGSFRAVTQQLGSTVAIHSILGGPQTQALRSMSKIKTHKGAAKRWKALANGLFKRRQTGLRHLNRKLSPSARRGKHAPVLCTKGQKRHLDRLLPY